MAQIWQVWISRPVGEERLVETVLTVEIEVVVSGETPVRDLVDRIVYSGCREFNAILESNTEMKESTLDIIF